MHFKVLDTNTARNTLFRLSAATSCLVFVERFYAVPRTEISMAVREMCKEVAI